MFGVQ